MPPATMCSLRPASDTIEEHRSKTLSSFSVLARLVRLCLQKQTSWRAADPLKCRQNYIKPQLAERRQTDGNINVAIIAMRGISNGHHLRFRAHGVELVQLSPESLERTTEDVAQNTSTHAVPGQFFVVVASALRPGSVFVGCLTHCSLM